MRALPVSAPRRRRRGGTVPRRRRRRRQGNYKNGKQALHRARLRARATCMATANAMSPSGIGPDLDTTRKSYTAIVTNITKGGKGMTGYKKTLTTTQILDLATFVYKSAHAA